MPLYDAPKKHKVSITKDRKVLQFRHPWVNSTVRLSIAKMTELEQEESRVAGLKLMELAPKTKAEMPGNIPDRLADQYLKHIDEADDVHTEITIDEKGNIEGVDAGTIVQDMIDLAKARRDRDRYKRDLVAAQAQIDNLLRSSGERSTAERRTTLKSCLEHWSQHVRIRRGSKQPKTERMSVIRRATAVLNAVGLDKKYGDLTLAIVQDGLDKSGHKSEAEKTKRGVDIQRFFKGLCKPKSQNGLAFSNDPSVGLDYHSPRQLQARRNAMGLKVEAGDPAALLPKLPPYWAAMYAMWAYCGLRRMEAAAIHWEHIDADKRIVSVLPSAVYPQLKNYLSVRPIRPFKPFWEWIEKYRQVRLNDAIVFPRTAKTDEYWIRITELGEPRIDHLTREMTRELVQAGLTKDVAQEPNLRARRYWATQVDIHCPWLKEQMGAHSAKMHGEHYADALRAVLAAAGDWC